MAQKKTIKRRTNKEVAALLERGFDRYCNKPIDVELLRTFIKRAKDLRVTNGNAR